MSSVCFMYLNLSAILSNRLFVSLQAVDFLSQVLDSPEKEAVMDAVRNLQDIGE